MFEAHDALICIGEKTFVDDKKRKRYSNEHYFKDSDYYISKGTSGVDFRAKNLEAIDNLEENSMDFYASVKSLYLQDRQQKILNSKQTTETQDDSDWDEVSSD